MVTEESILLRVLVQALVVVGIIATDIAAQTQVSFWAIPLSIIAAIWSWYSRRQRNLTAKFLIAVGMLLAMTAFFGNLFGSLHDSRLVLAELLIQLQVLHSFDLPRRKDLGYSMVIGLILLGVAATLSQTVIFAIWLLLFLGIALPVLVLDYRSRLGLKSHTRTSISPRRNSPIPNLPRNFFSFPFSLQRLCVLLLIILGLGLTIFAFLPRFPGSQQVIFPVNSPVELDNQSFDPERRGIFSPNVQAPADGGENASGVSQEQGEGTTEAFFYYGFQSKIDQAKANMGQLEPKAIMRVRSQAPGFWRVLAFDRYTGRGWEISRDENLTNVERPSWNYRFFLPTSRRKGKTKQVVQTYTLLSPLPNVIPALSYPQQLYFPSAEVAVDPEGSIRAPGTLSEGLTYTVVSQVPYRDRSQLRETESNYTKSISQYYLQIPEEIAPQVRKLTEELLATSAKPITSSYEQALFLAQALKQRYTLLQETPTLGEGEDLVETFLFRDKGGYGDQFSTVLTMMLRSVGIPARLTTGFGTGKFNPLTGFYVVRNTDAYAITEVFFPGYGWFTFDPIPGHPLIPQSVETVGTFGLGKQLWSWIAGWLPSPLTNSLSALWHGLINLCVNFSKWFWSLLSQGWLGIFTAIVLLGGMIILSWLGWRKLASLGNILGLGKLAPMEKLYRQMLKILATRGYPKHPAQTPMEYAIASRVNLQETAGEIVEEITQAYVAWRYGQYKPNTNYLRRRLRLLKPSR